MTAALSRHGRDITSVFDLLGQTENDLTAALGFTLARSPELLGRITSLLLPGASGEVTVQMETRDELGRTDLELIVGDHLAVIEAKRGWLLPGERQLAAYASRVLAAGNGVLATLSQASDDWAAHVLPNEVLGVPVKHLPWTTVMVQLGSARVASRGEQRHWLDELHIYLRRAVKVREPQDSWTYCVVISHGRPGGGGSHTYREIVDQGIYYHPFGSAGWPKRPPNFLAFRWGNHVQRIHRVTHAEVIPTMQTRWPDIPVDADTNQPHAVYQLGPPLPGVPIPCGKNYRANRMWVLLDHLLVGPTLQDAMANTDALRAT